MTTRREFLPKNIRSQGFGDIREGVTLKRELIRRSRCIRMSSEDHEANGYMHNLDLLIISHYLCAFLSYKKGDRAKR